MTTIKNQKFLLDENVDRRLAKLFSRLSYNCSSLNEFQLNGVTNGKLATWIRENNYVLVTHDQDFDNFWRIYNIKVLLIRIHPATLNEIQFYLEKFLSNYERELAEIFLIKLTRDGILYQSQ